ncbi:MAG: radical SAM protein [Thermodesulfobacteriota bacterium]
MASGRRIRTVEFSKDRVNVFFHILTACNLSCKHCYINPSAHGTRTLPIETIRAWIDLFAARKPSANIIFLGGEPTLHPDLSHAVRHARQRGYQSITIDTNGFLFHDILDKISPDEVDAISFSLDGAEARTNDRLRGKGCFDAVIQGIRKAVAAGFGISVIFTVSSANIHELPRMPALLQSLGVHRFFIQVVGLRGQSASKTETGQTEASVWLDNVPRVAEEAAERGITVTYPKVYLEPDETFECAGKVADNAFIFPNGRVYRCPLCEDHPLHSLEIVDNRLCERPPLTERELFELDIPEGCVMNRLIQPGNIVYGADGKPVHRIACCMLKQELT